MASITKYRTKNETLTCRVQIRLTGHPILNASFRRMSDAKKWANETEDKIRKARFKALMEVQF